MQIGGLQKNCEELSMRDESYQSHENSQGIVQRIRIKEEKR
jgi:hypothetical protein